MYPVRSIVRLGGPMEDAAIEAQSAQWVKDAEANLQRVLKDYNDWMSASVSLPHTRAPVGSKLRSMLWSSRGSKLSRRYYFDEIGARDQATWNSAFSDLIQERKRKEQAVAEARLRVKKQQSEALNRITNHVIYKGFSIRPLINNEQQSIDYQIYTRQGNAIGKPHDRLDEAKAVIDEGVAERQAAEVESWTQERIRAEAEARGWSVSEGGSTAPAQDTAQAKPFDKKWLLIGGAAAAGLLLLR